MAKEIECEHYNGVGFMYELDNKTRLYLCEYCNMNLAGEVMKQLALHTFMPEAEEKKND